jgi:hypothetical protein
MAWSVAPDLSGLRSAGLVYRLRAIGVSRRCGSRRTVAGGLRSCSGWSSAGRCSGVSSLFPEARGSRGSAARSATDPPRSRRQLRSPSRSARIGARPCAVSAGRGCCSSMWPSWRSCSHTRAPASRSLPSRLATWVRRLARVARCAGRRTPSPGSSRSGPSRPALTDDLRAYADRVDDGALFGVLLSPARRLQPPPPTGSPGARRAAGSHRLGATARVACRSSPRRGASRAQSRR